MNALRSIFVIVRYSLLRTRLHRFAREAGARDQEAYRSLLFDPARLERRLNLFRSITLPSLIGLGRRAREIEDVELHVPLLISPELPEAHRRQVEALAEPHDFLHVVEAVRSIDTASDFIRARCRSGMMASVRLDDDDALLPDYIDRLAPYVDPRFDGYGISFPTGYIGFVDEAGTFTSFSSIRSPNIALGLAYVCDAARSEVVNIYDFGPHTVLDETIPVILDSRARLYLRTAHLDSDTFSTAETMHKKKASFEKRRVPDEEVLRLFDWIEGSG